MTVAVGVDTYISVADADAYFAARGVRAWADAAGTARAAALLRATVYLDGAYRFAGRPADPGQALAWPRTGAADAEGRPVEGVPARVAHACAELALAALSEDLAPPEPRGGQVLEERVGPLSVRYAPGAPAGRSFPYVDLLLRGLVRPGGANPEVRRA